MNTENLNRKAKIELIRRIQCGEVKVINREIFGNILISKDGVYYFNEKPVKPEDLHKIEQGEETIIVLPAISEKEDYSERVVIAGMIEKGKNTIFAHLKYLQDHGETDYLTQALDYLSSQGESLPFSLSEVHELLHGGK